MKQKNYKGCWKQRLTIEQAGQHFCALILLSSIPVAAMADLSKEIESKDSQLVLSHEVADNAVLSQTEPKVIELEAERVDIQAKPVDVDTSANMTPAPVVIKDSELSQPAKDAIKEDAVVIAGVEHAGGLMPASLTTTEYTLPAQTLNQNAAGAVRVSADVDSYPGASQTEDKSQLPYALLPALLALIGLVPVSRRQP